MTNKLISIAMATYNGEKFLGEQLDSILSQTYSNLEIIICDDNSTDSTYTILCEYASFDSRIKLFKNDTNLGLVKNFERALSLSSGEYIALADQDDIWLPEKIKTLLNEIGNYDLICSSFKPIDAKGKEKFLKNKTLMNSLLFEKEIKFNLDTFFYNNFVTGCTALFSKSLLTKALPIPDNIYYHDWWLATIAQKQNGIKYLFNQPLILYRQHNENHTGMKIPSKEIYAYMQIKRLNALLLSDIFSPIEKTRIKEAIFFFTNTIDKVSRYQIFIISIKRSKAIWPNSRLLVRILKILKLLYEQ